MRIFNFNFRASLYIKFDDHANHIEGLISKQKNGPREDAKKLYDTISINNMGGKFNSEIQKQLKCQFNRGSGASVILVKTNKDELEKLQRICTLKSIEFYVESTNDSKNYKMIENPTESILIDLEVENLKHPILEKIKSIKDQIFKEKEKMKKRVEKQVDGFKERMDRKMINQMVTWINQVKNELINEIEEQLQNWNKEFGYPIYLNNLMHQSRNYSEVMFQSILPICDQKKSDSSPLRNPYNRFDQTNTVSSLNVPPPNSFSNQHTIQDTIDIFDKSAYNIPNQEINTDLPSHNQN